MIRIYFFYKHKLPVTLIAANHGERRSTQNPQTIKTFKESQQKQIKTSAKRFKETKEQRTPWRNNHLENPPATHPPPIRMLHLRPTLQPQPQAPRYHMPEQPHILPQLHLLIFESQQTQLPHVSLSDGTQSVELDAVSWGAWLLQGEE